MVREHSGMYDVMTLPEERIETLRQTVMCRGKGVTQIEKLIFVYITNVSQNFTE